jgi:two-component system, NarL family, sensor histidine kinase LiaS
MNIFRKLRWKLTLNYTIVTVSAFLVVLLLLVGIVLPRIYVPNNMVTPELLISIVQKNSNDIWSHVLSQSPVDTELIKALMKESNATITSFNFFRIGSVQLTIQTMAQWRALIVSPDGILLGKTENGFPVNYIIGQPVDPTRIQGLEAPFNAALAGDKDLSHLYTIYEPNERFIMAFPIINNPNRKDEQVVGATVLILDALPTQTDVPTQILNITGRSLLIFLLGIGIMGAIFGAFFAHGLSNRFKRLTTTIDAWSKGDFSIFIEDATGDEISQFAQRLNNMAKQLQDLLHRRQEMAVSEERNRLARDLHDSAKQQALAASFQLGTALTLYEREPQEAKKHLVEADELLDSVKNELTNLVHELRPQTVDGQDFAEMLKEYAADWSNRSGIEMDISIAGNDELSLEIREALFRIVQEALANSARHSSAHHANISIEYGVDMVKMIIKDDGHGFDKSVQHTGLGLYSMRERAEVLGGTFAVESSPDLGTKIVVSLPRAVL